LLIRFAFGMFGMLASIIPFAMGVYFLGAPDWTIFLVLSIPVAWLILAQWVVVCPYCRTLIRWAG
jgi:hypothetical protein